LPEQPAAAIRDDIIERAAQQSEFPRVLVFGCKNDGHAARLGRAGAIVISIKCMAHLQPSYLDFALSRGHADGVLLLGCEDGNCAYRYGATWTEQRVARTRDPRLRKRTDTTRIALGWLSPWSDKTNVVEKYQAFRASLKMDESPAEVSES
jgi:coenzyme F420-reducing hydrogenase delta subunit